MFFIRFTALASSDVWPCFDMDDLHEIGLCLCRGLFAKRPGSKYTNLTNQIEQNQGTMVLTC